MGRESHMFRSENGYGNQEAGFAPLLKYLKKIAPPPPPDPAEQWRIDSNSVIDMTPIN